MEEGEIRPQYLLGTSVMQLIDHVAEARRSHWGFIRALLPHDSCAALGLIYNARALSRGLERCLEAHDNASGYTMLPRWLEQKFGLKLRDDCATWYAEDDNHINVIVALWLSARLNDLKVPASPKINNTKHVYILSEHFRVDYST